MVLKLEIDQQDCFTEQEIDDLIEKNNMRIELMQKAVKTGSEINEEMIEFVLVHSPLNRVYSLAKQMVELSPTPENKAKFSELRARILHKYGEVIQKEAQKELLQIKNINTKLHLLKNAILNAK